MAEQKLEQAIGKVLLNFNIDTLKLEQRKMLDALLSSKDCIGVLPTGYGKSLPYQMLVSIKRELGIDDAKVVVCSPLVALMQDQTQRLRNIPGIKAEYTGSSAAANENILMGHFDYLFSSPEILVGDKDWREKLQRFKVSTIVVDEFHTIATWGEKEDESKQAFRKWFSYIGELRSLFPDASILALSATCTKQISKRVLKVLQLDPNAVEIRISPNKPNIKLVVNKILNTVEMAMCWLVDGLCDKALPKTMIYCTSIKDAANIYAYISTEIPNCKEVQMFHSETSPDSKKRIMECLKDPTSSIKVVIATSALGMGIDMIGFSNVIIYGAPKTIVDLIQEIGRVGRDGKEAVALLLHNSYHLRDVETEVKDLFKATECRRISLLAPFMSKTELEEEKKTTGLHSCCDLCASKCLCGSCKTTELEKLFKMIASSSEDPCDTSSDEDTESYDLFDYLDSVDLSLIMDLDLD